MLNIIIVGYEAMNILSLFPKMKKEHQLKRHIDIFLASSETKKKKKQDISSTLTRMQSDVRASRNAGSKMNPCVSLINKYIYISAYLTKYFGLFCRIGFADFRQWHSSF